MCPVNQFDFSSIGFLRTNLSRRIGRLANLLNLPFLTSREYNLYFRKKKEGVFDIFFIFRTTHDGIFYIFLPLIRKARRIVSTSIFEIEPLRSGSHYYAVRFHPEAAFRPRSISLVFRAKAFSSTFNDVSTDAATTFHFFRRLFFESRFSVALYATEQMETPPTYRAFSIYLLVFKSRLVPSVSTRRSVDSIFTRRCGVSTRSPIKLLA